MHTYIKVYAANLYCIYFHFHIFIFKLCQIIFSASCNQMVPQVQSSCILETEIKILALIILHSQDGTHKVR